MTYPTAEQERDAIVAWMRKGARELNVKALNAKWWQHRARAKCREESDRLFDLVLKIERGYHHKG